MVIKTKFNINDLVFSKYQRNPITNIDNPEAILCFEVIDINTGTCMAGTQIFYVCRTIHGHSSSEWIEGKKVIKFKDYCIGSNSKGEYQTLREDEIVKAPKEVIDLLLNK